jgi:hypothetical protein
MAFLTEADLVNFYPKAVNVEAGDKRTYLQRANAFCKGVIGGEPPTVDDDLKAAVALAFEIMAQGETAQIEEITGNITEAAPPGQYARNSREKDPLDVVRNMLRPYRLAFEAANAAKSDRGVAFL